MKTYYRIFVLLLAAVCSCEGSDTYRGSWKAMNANGNKFEITFSPKSFSIKDSTGKSSNYVYSQNSIKTENSIKTYGIRLDDGGGYLIHFPKKDESVALILDENGNAVFTLSRKNYISYEDIYRLN